MKRRDGRAAPRTEPGESAPRAQHMRIPRSRSAELAAYVQPPGTPLGRAKTAELPYLATRQPKPAPGCRLYRAVCWSARGLVQKRRSERPHQHPGVILPTTAPSNDFSGPADFKAVRAAMAQTASRSPWPTNHTRFVALTWSRFTLDADRHRAAGLREPFREYGLPRLAIRHRQRRAVRHGKRSRTSYLNVVGGSRLR